MTVLSCGQKGSNEHKNENQIKRVTFAISSYGCENGCPAAAVSIDSNLTINYYGGKFSYRKGYFKGKINRTTWDSIQFRFNKFISYGIDTTKLGKTDCPFLEIYITDKKSKHIFKINSGKLAKTDSEILKWFQRIAETAPLEQTDSLTFETSIQLPIPIKD